MTRPRAFLDFSVNHETLGRVILELYNDTAPKTCENFRVLCTGERGISPSSLHPLYYKNSTIHRSIKDFMIQGGDFTKFNGTGGESIYGNSFADEDLTRSLDAEGLLCMANKGPNTNNSQFFITLRDCPHLNGKHVVFGRVIRGYDTVQKIAALPVDGKDRPLSPVVISNCGELELRKPSRKSAESTSPERASSEKPRKKRSRSPNREQHRSKKAKSKRKHSLNEPDLRQEETGLNKGAAVEETEEEYDARLEREEKERLEAARIQELIRVKEKYEADLKSNHGVQFKGRGRMKFADPELGQQRTRGPR